MVLISILATTLATGCGERGDAARGGREVVAAFYPLAFAAERIAEGGDEVVNLTPAGAEPHDLELSARTVERVRRADVVLYLGGGFQPALEEALEGARGRRVDLLEGVALLAEGDPHVWLDPVRFAGMAERLGNVLGRPARGRALADELRSLDAEYRRGLESCARRDLVTSHAAFVYLASRYGLEQVAVTGRSPEAEVTAADLERVVRVVRERGATTVFVETLVSPRLAETVAREAGADTAVLNPLEGLTEEEIEGGEDYFSVMRANLVALRKGLGCR